MEKCSRTKSVSFPILHIGPIIKKIPKFWDDPLKYKFNYFKYKSNYFKYKSNYFKLKVKRCRIEIVEIEYNFRTKIK